MKKLSTILASVLLLIACSKVGNQKQIDDEGGKKQMVNHDVWLRFTSHGKNAVFRYPSQWSGNSDAGKLYFQSEGKDYSFGYFNGYGLHYDSEQVETLIFNGYTFERTYYFRGKKVFLVTYTTKDFSMGSDGISGDVPMENSEHFLGLFDEIMNTIEKSEATPEPLDVDWPIF